MELLLLLLFAVPLSSAETHSLKHFFTAVRGIHMPEFTSTSQVDGEQFVFYNSEMRKMSPRTEWIKKVVADEPDYWTSQTQIMQENEKEFKVNMDKAMHHFNETEGVHTVQWLVCCELDDDGTSRGYAQFGYDGEDFFTLDLDNVTWTAANEKAQRTKHYLDNVCASAKNIKNYLGSRCIERLRNYVSYGRKTLERRDPPEVQVFQTKRPSSPELVCHATGFFPNAVMMSWQKDGEEVEEDVELSETLPNQDGSFQKRIILRVSPEDLQKNKYTCVIQHSSLKEELSMKHGGYKPASSGSASEGGDSASNGS